MATTRLPLVGGHPQGFGASLRTDRWWVGPVTTVSILTGFIVYATWAAFQGKYYYASPYLSPFYSPVLFFKSGVPGAALPSWHVWFGEWPAWWPSFLPASPAFFILPFPGLFRFTCYYYRKAYYRGFYSSPPACAVVPAGTGSRVYHGETRFLAIHNLHRFAMYFALVFVPILYFDAVMAFFHDGKFGVGVGSIVLLINATLLGGYTLGCHSFRHLIGGRDDCMSCGKATVKYKLWRRVSFLNERHMNYAWFSLFWVALTDVYVRLVSMGVIRDFNTWGIQH